MKIKLFLAALALSATAVSCEDSGDVSKPEIDLTSPADGQTVGVSVDEGMHFEVEFTDDVALSSYKVNIHSAAGHDHSSSVKSTDSWEFNQTWDDISGQKNAYRHHHEIVIDTPEELYGDYHFMVYCTDAAGNESYVVRTITIAAEGDDHDDEE